MKRKPQHETGSPVAPEILKVAKRSVSGDVAMPPERVARGGKCSVCGDEATQTPGDPLCWVCRRLKISAWREVEQQAPAQE